jgi:hypothetical protein
MLSTATTSNQHQPNFWFTTNPLPSFFSSTDKNLYLQQPTTKISFDTNPCSSSSESSPNDYLLTRSTNPTTTLNLTQFNYIQQNHHHHSSTNNFLSRDDWSQIPVITSPNSTAWNKGKDDLISFLTSDLIYAILL